MKRVVLLLFGLVILSGLASSTYAQAFGSCEPGTASGVLETPMLKASVFNTGSLFFGQGATSGDGYLIPKQDGTSSIYAAGLWLGGKVGGELRVGAARYGEWDFWPGPLEDAARPPADCSEHDRIYVVSREDVARFLTTGEQTNDLRDWPYHLGAPVLDGDGDTTNYDLRAGDQPELLGDVAAWWVMNDAGNNHGRSGAPYGEDLGPPLGVEVRVLAFAFGDNFVAQSRALTQTTFYRYEILNRGRQPVDSMYAAMWADPDLGDAGDDYIGTDTLRNMMFVYNSDEVDSAYGTPPSLGIQVLKGPVVGSDTLGATSANSLYFCGTPIGMDCVEPSGAPVFYNYMQGLWVDGTPITKMGQGYRSNGPVTSFVYPGDPVTESFWSEVNNDNAGGRSQFGDRRMVVTTGPFKLATGASQTILFAFPFGQGTDYLNSVAVMRGYASTLQSLHADGFFTSSRVEDTRNQPVFELALSRVRPNPSVRQPEVVLTLPAETHVRAVVYDALGRQIEVLVDAVLPEGETALGIPNGLAPGTYLLRVEVRPGGEETLTFTVVR